MPSTAPEAQRRRLQAVFYRTLDGSEPVAKYIDAMPIKKQVMLNNHIGRLNELTDATPHLPFPWSSQVRGELRELRCQVGGERHRILFARSRGLFILLHAFLKNSQKLPEEEIRIAELRWDDYSTRMNSASRRRPRAAGHDAPRHRDTGRK
jgi:phage-related protein